MAKLIEEASNHYDEGKIEDALLDLAAARDETGGFLEKIREEEGL